MCDTPAPGAACVVSGVTPIEAVQTGARTTHAPAVTAAGTVPAKCAVRRAASCTHDVGVHMRVEYLLFLTEHRSLLSRALRWGGATETIRESAGRRASTRVADFLAMGVWPAGSNILPGAASRQIVSSASPRPPGHRARTPQRPDPVGHLGRCYRHFPPLQGRTVPDDPLPSGLHRVQRWGAGFSRRDLEIISANPASAGTVDRLAGR